MVRLFVEGGDFVGLKQGGKVAGNDFRVGHGRRFGHEQELQGTARDGMRDGGADAIDYAGQGECGRFDLGGGHFVAPDVDDVVLAADDAEAALFVNMAKVGSEERVVVQYLAGKLGVACVSGHERCALAGNGALVGDEEARMGHGVAHAAADARVVVVEGGNDARLGGGVGVVKARAGKQGAEATHVVGRDGCGSRLDEVELVGIPLQSFGGKEDEHANVGRHEERGQPARGIVQCTEEGVEVGHALQEVERGPANNRRKDLGERAEMTEWAADDEDRVVTIALCGDEVRSVGHNGLVANDDTLRSARRSGGVENVGRVVGECLGRQLFLDGAETSGRCVLV